MQPHQLFHKPHLLVQRQFHPSENDRNHSCAHFLMVMERPAVTLIEFFGGGFGNIMQNGRPAEPEVVGSL
ncbi:hypothetical protein D3C86_2149020 [compost metagenome]